MSDLVPKKDHGLVYTIVQRAPWWVPWLFLFFLWGGWAIYQFMTVSTVAESNQAARVLILEAQIEQCERVNDIRVEITEQYQTVEEVLLLASTGALERGEQELAREFLSLSARIRELPTVECEEAFPEDIARAGIDFGL